MIRQFRQVENIKIIEFFYFMNDDLIYYINLIDFCHHFCILKNLEKEIFQMTHNEHYYIDFYQVYNMIVISLFIQNLS